MAENVNVAVNLAVTAHPLKFKVTEADPELIGAIFPTPKGNEAGLVITGVQAAPNVCVKLNELICAEFAAPGPLLVSVRVQTLAFDGPLFAVMFPLTVVAPGRKFAVTT